MGNRPKNILNMELAHPTPHPSLKELAAANSRDAGAGNFEMCVEYINETALLIVKDDGKGPCARDSDQPSRDSFLDILDVGHATTADQNTTIGEVRGVSEELF